MAVDLRKPVSSAGGYYDKVSCFDLVSLAARNPFGAILALQRLGLIDPGPAGHERPTAIDDLHNLGHVLSVRRRVVDAGVVWPIQAAKNHDTGNDLEALPS